MIMITENIFEFYTFLAVDSVRHVTSEEDMSDRHFLPLDVDH